MNIERRDLPGREPPKPRIDIDNLEKVDQPETPTYKPEEPMLSKVWKFTKKSLRGILGGGLLGGGGLIAGIDVETAVLIAVSGALLIAGVDFEIVEKFKKLFGNDKEK